MKLGKINLLLLAFMMLFGTVACSNNQATENNTPQRTEQTSPTNENTTNADELTPEPGAKLLVWDGKDGLPFLTEIAKQFSEKYNIPVEVQEQGAPEQMTKMKIDGPAGLAADLLVLPHDNLSEAIAGGFVLPNDFFEEETKAEFQETAVNAVTKDGILYGYPRNMETYALFYNKELVKESDLNSWDDIIRFSKTFNDVGTKKYGFMMQLNNLYFAYPFFSGYKGYVFGDNNTNPEEIGLNSAGAVEAMKYFQSMREILPMEAADATGDVKTALFQEGKLAINLDGVWNIGNFSELPFEVGMVPLPKFPSGEVPNTFAGVKAYYVSAYSKYPNAAKLFARYVTTKEALLKNFEVSGFIPARKGMENEAVIKDNAMVSGAIRQFEHSIAMPSIFEMQQVWAPMANALELIWKGEDPQTTLDNAVKSIKEGIQTLHQ
ncbi:sugar ABC transporter substrate-binding protein [Paenibacillus wynnii]|uniref:sugar ABC transporter substrate-binding protein n=1 Tax=Paenibacillus wynnii TaxID=268407 RepID=UPI002794090B|nr:maltose ABC transporter substrate-binding protein [Paenibacillus wynnii]MDQ0194901.1 arabinogalactan oligomer/maltooligosaccharide transport system substrate-binding protein [Paenibacillus wynnii]